MCQGGGGSYEGVVFPYQININLLNILTLKTLKSNQTTGCCETAK